MDVLLGADSHDEVGVVDDGGVFHELLVGDDFLMELLCKGQTHALCLLCHSENNCAASVRILPFVISLLSLRPPHREMVTEGKSDMWSQ